MRDYVDSDGEPGYFQLDYFVYGREGEPCRVCGASIRALRQGGRATYYLSALPELGPPRRATPAVRCLFWRGLC